MIVDWVPAHFPRDDFGLRRFDGSALYEHEDPRLGEHPDWGTLIFNYGRPEVRNFLVANALFWLDAYHVDGLRVDAVASMLYLDYSRKAGEWLPNRYGGRENLDAITFLREVNERCYGRHPGTFIVAEESTAFGGITRPTYAGGMGFGMKWDLGWMHDHLDYFSRDPVHRRWHHDRLTFRSLYQYSEHFVLPLSHDEVVHGKGSLLGKMPGDEWQRFANLRCLLADLYTQPGASCSSWAPSWRRWRSGRTTASCHGTRRMIRSAPPSPVTWPTWARCTDPSPRCGVPTRTPTGSGGSTRPMRMPRCTRTCASIRRRTDRWRWS